MIRWNAEIMHSRRPQFAIWFLSFVVVFGASSSVRGDGAAAQPLLVDDCIRRITGYPKDTSGAWAIRDVRIGDSTLTEVEKLKSTSLSLAVRHQASEAELTIHLSDTSRVTLITGVLRTQPPAARFRQGLHVLVGAFARGLAVDANALEEYLKSHRELILNCHEEGEVETPRLVFEGWVVQASVTRRRGADGAQSYAFMLWAEPAWLHGGGR